MWRHLRIGFWNLNGLNSSILGNKLKTNDFLSINKHYIFALVETHATYETEMNISKFKHFTKCRNQSGSRSSGGGGAIRIYINKKIAKGVTYTPSENKNVIWCKLDKTYFTFQKDIYLGTIYLSPPNYERNGYSSEDLIGELEEEMFLFSKKGDVIVQGYYNARTGGIQETVLDDDNTFLNVPEDYENDEQCLGHKIQVP